MISEIVPADTFTFSASPFLILDHVSKERVYVFSLPFWVSVTILYVSVQFPSLSTSCTKFNSAQYGSSFDPEVFS